MSAHVLFTHEKLLSSILLLVAVVTSCVGVEWKRLRMALH